MQGLEHHPEIPTEKTAHCDQDLSDKGYCCGDTLVICSNCKHRGMCTTEVITHGAMKNLRCPQCGRYSSCHFDVEEGSEA